MQYKVLLFDLDGTLLQSDKSISEYPDNIIAFGDDLVDIGMLKLCGKGIAEYLIHNYL